MKLLECVNIKKSYGIFRSTEAVKGIDFGLEKGQCIAIVGPNGAGKTTLLRVLAGVIAAFQGSLKVDGKIGYCSETTSNYPYLTGYENLKFFADVSCSLSAVKETLKKVGLERDNKLVYQYSKGMKRKLEIARSLVLDADIVIMDEPFDGLDPIASKDIVNIIIGLKKENKGIILTSHDLYHIQEVADEIFFMSNGVFSRHEIIGNQLRLKIGLQNMDEMEIRLSFLGKRLIRQDKNFIYISIENTCQIPDLVAEMIENGARIDSVGTEPLEDLFMETFNEHA
jgi:ABC-type multidrug transport system ATPase subunit